MPTSWAPEVFVEGKWSRNGVRLATEQEALASARNLMMRWMLVENVRATEAEEPVNYCWANGELVQLDERPLVQPGALSSRE